MRQGLARSGQTAGERVRGLPGHTRPVGAGTFVPAVTWASEHGSGFSLPAGRGVGGAWGKG